MVGIAGSAEHRTAEKLLLNLSARFLIFKKTETKPTLSEGVAALCVSCESGTEGGCLYLCPSEFAENIFEIMLQLETRLGWLFA